MIVFNPCLKFCDVLLQRLATIQTVHRQNLAWIRQAVAGIATVQEAPNLAVRNSFSGGTVSPEYLTSNSEQSCEINHLNEQCCDYPIVETLSK